MIRIERTTSDNEGFKELIGQLDKELWSIYNDQQAIYSQYNGIENNQNVIVAYKDTMAIGCGCFKHFDEETVEIKRMYVKPEYRGQKIATSILQALEKWASELLISETILETGNKQKEAIHLYGKSGYIVVENYGPYANMPDSICMRKKLA
jgi:GNAT superfamily N-acetyltransferase